MTLTLSTLFYQWRAFSIVPVSHLAIQAIVTFIGVDLSGRADSPYLTFMAANLAGAAAFLVTPQPVKNTKPGGEGKGCPQGTQITAEELTIKGGY